MLSIFLYLMSHSRSLWLSLSLFHVGSTFQCWILSNSLSTFFQINSSHPPCSLCVPLSDNITTTPFSLSLFLSSLIPDTFSLVFGVLSVCLSLSLSHTLYLSSTPTHVSLRISLFLSQTNTHTITFSHSDFLCSHISTLSSRLLKSHPNTHIHLSKQTTKVAFTSSFSSYALPSSQSPSHTVVSVRARRDKQEVITSSQSLTHWISPPLTQMAFLSF